MRSWLVIGVLLVGSGNAAVAGEAASPASPPEAGRVVARVGGAAITYQDLTIRIQILENEGERIAPERYPDILRGMVREEILLQAAIAEQVDQRPDVKARVEQVRRHLLIDSLLRQKLAALGQVTEEEIRKAYDEQKGLFTRTEVRISHIMVSTEAEAEAIRKEVAAGRDFAALARAKSQDAGSADKGGDLGILSPGLTDRVFEEAAGKLAEGEISPVVKTDQGYHVLKGGARESVVESFADVKGRLQEMLVQQKQRRGLAVYVTTLELKAQPEVFEDRLR
jgi:EpsD family peptidyl-prolyl cis-trans isomerase